MMWFLSILFCALCLAGTLICLEFATRLLLHELLREDAPEQGCPSVESADETSGGLD